MRIGIDIDDTTVVTIHSMIKYADKYNSEVLGLETNNDKLGLIQNRYYLKAIYGWDDTTKYNFFEKYYKNVLEECVILPFADEIINKLKNEGNEIFFVTARLSNIPGCNVEEITKKTLEKYNISYDNLFVNILDKVSFCREKNIDIFVEDSYETCVELEKNGIKTYFMTTLMNKNIKEEKTRRVNNWNEIYEHIHSK